MRTIEIVEGSVLDFPFDADARLARVPPKPQLKGMFFARLVELLGPDGWAELQPRLLAAPRFGTYIPFADYPQRDYIQLVYATARRTYPDLPMAESTRRLAREDFATFGQSRFGAFLLRLAQDARGAFEVLPTAWGGVVKGGVMTGEPFEGGYRLKITGFHGWMDSYIPGQFEGIAAHYREHARITVRLTGELDATFDILLS